MTDNASTTAPQERDLVAQLTLEYLDVLNGSSDHLPPLNTLDDDLRRRVLRAWEGIDRLIDDEPLPPLSTDPVAIALGAVPDIQLDPAALRRQRQATNLRPSEIARFLRQRGWPVTTSDVFAWEQHAELVAPALLHDFAALLGVREANLTSAEANRPALSGQNTDDENTLLEALRTADLNEIVQQWAELLGLDVEAARGNLGKRLSGAAHRGTRTLTIRQLKAVLAVLLEAERARRNHPAD
jgi:DNA-binding transcriptional regulator YiaG